MKISIAYSLVLLSIACVFSAAMAGGDESVAPDTKTQVQNDVPQRLRLRNKVGTNGLGLCVFTSCNVSAFWQNVGLLQDFRDWMTKHPGGGYPSKLDEMISRRAKEKGLPPPQYLQFTSNDLLVLKMAVKTGRVPCVTYYYSPTGRYQGKRISHMVNIVHAGVGQAPDGSSYWAVLDNNYPEKLEWMTEPTFLKVYSGGGTGWSVIFLNPGPPPVPIQTFANYP